MPHRQVNASNGRDDAPEQLQEGVRQLQGYIHNKQQQGPAAAAGLSHSLGCYVEQSGFLMLALLGQ